MNSGSNPELLKETEETPFIRKGLSLEELNDFQQQVLIVLLAMFACRPYLEGLSVVQGLE